MKIGVISDTHIPRTADAVPEQIFEAFKDVDLILHAGDITSKNVLNDLKRLAPVKAVCGNMDDPDLRDQLPNKQVIKAGKFRIGLIHGFGPPFGMIDRIMKEFHAVDIIVFGHSHTATNKKKNNILFFNPGSPTDRLFARSNSYGILEINGNIKGEIVKL